jgi:hypothetical protein
VVPPIRKASVPEAVWVKGTETERMPVGEPSARVSLPSLRKLAWAVPLPPEVSNWLPVTARVAFGPLRSVAPRLMTTVPEPSVPAPALTTVPASRSSLEPSSFRPPFARSVPPPPLLPPLQRNSFATVRLDATLSVPPLSVSWPLNVDTLPASVREPLEIVRFSSPARLAIVEVKVL